MQHFVSILDPSDVYRPDASTFADKDLRQFRDYTVKVDDPIKERVFQTYSQMHRNQTVEFVQGKKAKILLNLMSASLYESLIWSYK